jgi:hypothetical protein
VKENWKREEYIINAQETVQSDGFSFNPMDPMELHMNVFTISSVKGRKEGRVKFHSQRAGESIIINVVASSFSVSIGRKGRRNNNRRT